MFTYPCRQKKHSPQNISTFTVTLSPGLTEVTSWPTSSTTPTISCPTVIPGTARGTLPCLMCKSLVQMLPNVTRTMASRPSCNSGRGFSLNSNLPCSTNVYASIIVSFLLNGSFRTQRKRKASAAPSQKLAFGRGTAEPHPIFVETKTAALHPATPLHRPPLLPFTLRRRRLTKWQFFAPLSERKKTETASSGKFFLRNIHICAAYPNKNYGIFTINCKRLISHSAESD